MYVLVRLLCTSSILSNSSMYHTICTPATNKHHHPHHGRNTPHSTPPEADTAACLRVSPSPPPHSSCLPHVSSLFWFRGIAVYTYDNNNSKGLTLIIYDARLLSTCGVLCIFVCLCAALPADSYEQTKVLAPLFNTLVDKISRDGPWLKEVLKDVLVSGMDR